MTNEAFDHIIKQKLQDHVAAIPEGLWDKIRMPAITPPADQFDQFVQDKLYNHSGTVSPELWNRIKPEEDEDKKYFFFLPRAGMVAASILLLIIAGSVSAYLYYQKFQSPANPIENSNQKNNNQGNSNGNKNNTIEVKEEDQTNQPTESSLTPTENESNKNEIQGSKSVDNDMPNSSNHKTNITAESMNNGSSLSFGILKKQSQNIQFNNTNSSSETLKPSSNLIEDELNYIATQKFDASLISFRNKNLRYLSTEKQIANNNHVNNIKNVVICPTDRKMRNPDWDLEIYASPDYAFKTVSSNTASQEYMNTKDSSEKSKLGYTVGFRIIKPINDHLLFKTGLQYSQINENFIYTSENEIKTTTVVTVRNIILANGNTVTVSDTSILQQIGFKNNTVKNSFRSLDIPVLIGYQFGNDDLRIGINAGLIFNLSSSFKGVVLDSSLSPKPFSKETNSVYKNNIGVGIYTGISITKRLTYNTSIFAEPYFRYNLSNSTTPLSTFNQRFSIGGLTVGLRLNLNNR